MSGEDLESARGDLSDAQVALVESLGIVPSTRLQVADVTDKSFAENRLLLTGRILLLKPHYSVYD
jgi:hypothetical protein